jgi:hypothetical protein
MKHLKYIREHLAQIIATVIASAVISAAGAIVSVKINDARQDTTLDIVAKDIVEIKTQLTEINKYLRNQD